MKRRLLPACLFCLAAVPGIAEDAGWKDLAGLRFDAAMAAFNADSSGEALIGEALAILSCPPRTESRVDAADHLLSEAAKDPSVAAAAEYFRARILQTHRIQPDLEKARSAFDAVNRQFPQSIYGQMALVKWAMLTAGDSAHPVRDFDLMAVRGEALRDPDAVRDFHLFLADAAAHWGLPPETGLKHLRMALDSGTLRGPQLGTTLVRIGELSRELGRKEDALEAYGEFVRHFPRDERTFTIRQRMEDLR